MALKKMEFIIRPTSTITVEQAISSVINTLNAAQNDPGNKINATTYKNDFFGSIFDSRDNGTYLIFSDVAQAKYEIPTQSINTTVEIDTSNYYTKQEVDEAIANIDLSEINSRLDALESGSNAIVIV